MTIDDVSHTMELSGGGGSAGPLQGFYSVDRGDHGWGHSWECPHDDVGMRPQLGTARMYDDRVPATNIEAPYGGGTSSLPGVTGSHLLVKFPAAPVLLADGPQLGSWRVTVVRVNETPAGDASGWECPHAEQDRQRPSDVSELHGVTPPRKLLEMFFQWCRLGAPP